MRRRYQIASTDRILGAVARQAGRQYALSEKLAEDMLAGELEHQRRVQERWASAVRGFRKTVEQLEATAGRSGREGGVTLEEIKARYTSARGPE